MKKIIFLSLTIIPALVIFLNIRCAESPVDGEGQSELEKGFLHPPREARPDVLWWWLNSNISEAGISRDLEEMKKCGIGGALIFDAAPVDRWKAKDVDAVPVGPAFLSERWRALFRHAVREADRLGLELGVSMTSGFNAGGPWVTPESGQQEIVWSQLTVDASAASPIHLPLPAGPLYSNDGKLLRYNEMLVNNDLERQADGSPVHYKDIAVLAIPVGNKELPSPASNTHPADSAGRLKNWALKSVHSFSYPENKGFVFDAVYDNMEDVPGEACIRLDSLINLSDSLDSRGNLKWTVPSGRWNILRFGQTHTGIRLQATNPHNEGLAMNHLSKEAARRHFDETGKHLLEDINAVGGRSLAYFYLDSWEVRIANWTDTFVSEFKQRRGYDCIPFLPVLAGLIVGNREISNRFLHDYRMTLGDCIADNYYGIFSELAHQHGLQYRAEMATTPIPVDMLKCLGRTDVPFGEFWTETDLSSGRIEPWERHFGKQAASAAHIYGLRFAAAEALTVIQKHWEHSPFQLKKTVDQAFCAGLNRLMIHTFTHSPPNIKPPGYEYFAGTHFNPNITWWSQAGAFTGYISRCQYLLQQGRFIADVCFYQGDRIPAFVSMRQAQPGLGTGYDYDVINTEVLLNRMSVQDGWLVLPDGLRYRMLVLPQTDRINLAVLKKITRLVWQGATIIGPKPARTYGLENFPQNDSLVRDLADRMWGNCDGDDITENKYGRGRIIYGKTPRQVLIEAGIVPDFSYHCREKDADIDFIHRRLPDAALNTDIYFISNAKDRWEEIEAVFRITDRQPEIWLPQSGRITEQIIFKKESRQLTMPLRLAPFGSAFIVFRKPLPALYIEMLRREKQTLFPRPSGGATPLVPLNVLTLTPRQIVIQSGEAGDYTLGLNDQRMIEYHPDNMPHPLLINGPWRLIFPPGWGAPDSVTLPYLISWTDVKDPGVKYFSGTATYRRDFNLPSAQFRPDLKYFLDLGAVNDVAVIKLNDRQAPVLWSKPFRTDITQWIHAGENRLEIKITNLWPNRLIGDQYLRKDKRFAYTNIGKFTAQSPLLPSGLLGPVQIDIVRQDSLNY